MKRLILLATMMVAVLASCEKHEIRNEVLTEIGFTSNVGKQTKAIVDNTTYLTTQPFGVYSYSHQENTGTNGADKISAVMNNVEIVSSTVDNATIWKANDSFGKFYWPNDDRTTMNFYAFSPYYYSSSTTSTDTELKFVTGNGNGISHNESTGLTLTNYKHDNMYVDFMVAQPVYNAKYNHVASNGTVSVKFHHQLTQLVFKVKTDDNYAGTDQTPRITFTVNNIKLFNIHDQGTYTNTSLTYKETNGTWAGSEWSNGVWTNTSGTHNYSNVFPTASQEATEVGYDTPTTDDEENTLITTGITVIPQNLGYTANRTDNCTDQYLEITYTIAGTNVAEETVVRRVYFTTDQSLKWSINKKYTYTILIGLKEIKFSPSVSLWGDDNGDGDTDDDGEGNVTPGNIVITQ